MKKVLIGLLGLTVSLTVAQSLFPSAPSSDGQPKVVASASLIPYSLTRFGYSSTEVATAEKNGLRRSDIPSVGSALVWLGGTTFMGLTDRGPNEDHLDANGAVDGKIFPLPQFNPAMVKFELRGNQLVPLEIIPITTLGGQPVTGLSTEKADDPIFTSASSNASLAYNQNGVDVEAMQQLPNGYWMMAEEYSSSLLVLNRRGQVMMRYTPQGKRLSKAGYPVRDILPQIFVNRRNNRGFENLAVSKDGKTAWTIVQSPMGATADKAFDESKIARAVRLDISDPLNAKVTGMYAVPFSPRADYPATKRQRDLKYSEAVWLSGEKLLMLERADKLVKLFVVDFANATNFLNRPEAATLVPERVDTNLATLGIKTTERTEVFSSASTPAIDEEKLEGMAVLSEGAIALIHDNDFGIGDNKTNAPTKFWIVQLAKALPLK